MLVMLHNQALPSDHGRDVKSMKGFFCQKAQKIKKCQPSYALYLLRAKKCQPSYALYLSRVLKWIEWELTFAVFQNRIILDRQRVDFAFKPLKLYAVLQV